MRRYLPLCLLVTLLPLLAGCGESPNRPSVVTVTPSTPPKTNARFIQAPWDISLLFNLPGGAVVAGATAATTGGAAEGDNLTGTFVNSTGFSGTLTGVLTGTLENGTFNGTLSTITRNGCTAERRFSGPINSQALNWSPGAHVNDCGGNSPLTSGIQVTAAPPSAPPPCLTYGATATGTSVPTAGGTGTVSVTAGEGCTWFATSSADFVTLSASQGTAAGSVQFTVAANTSTTQRTAVLVVAGSSFTITQAPAPVCTYRLNGGERTFDASGALGGVDMRVGAGCAWQAQSDAPWLTITSGASGSGDGTISYAVAANPGLTPRVGQITATGDQDFTVTQLGIVCQFTVTPSTTAAQFSGGSGTIQVVPNAAVCPWTATVSPTAPWITLTPPGGTGQGSVAFTVAANPDPVARSGVVTVAGREIAIAQAAAPCVFTVTPSQTAFPEAGGAGTVAIVTPAGCSWTAVSDFPWITLPGPVAGAGNGTVPFNVARNADIARSGTMTIAGQAITITQAQATVGTLSGTITNGLTGGPVSGASVVVGNLTATTGPGGTYTLSNVPQGPQTVGVSAPAFVSRSDSVVVGFQTTHSVPLTPGTPALTFLYNANPVFPNEADRHCGEPENVWCWSYTNTLQNTGSASLTVTQWEINLYGVENNLEQNTVFSAADFPRFYGGATGVPANGTAVGGAIVFFNSSSGGTIEIIISGNDPFGRPYRFVASPRLAAQERVLNLRAAPGGGRSTAAPPPRPRGGR